MSPQRSPDEVNKAFYTLMSANFGPEEWIKLRAEAMALKCKMCGYSTTHSVSCIYSPKWEGDPPAFSPFE